MSFQEKSTVATLVTLLAAYSVYWLVLSAATSSSVPLSEVPFLGPLIVMTIVLVVLIVAAHVVIAVFSPRTAGTEDERDRLVGLRGSEVGGLVLGVAVFAGIALTIFEVDHFWLANALLAGLVLAEGAEAVTKLVLYQRGV